MNTHTDQNERPDPAAQLMGITRQQLAALKPKEQVKHMLEQNKRVISEALPRHMNPERMMRVAITSVTSVPALLECYVPTLIGGIITAAGSGEPGRSGSIPVCRCCRWRHRREARPDL